MTSEVLVDALPYIDQGYDEPGVRESAVALVDEECRRYRPTKNYLEYLPALNMSAFETPLMLHEFERISNRVPMEALSMKRYELPPPPPGKTTDEPAWLESVNNSRAQLEHQSIRALNLDLMVEYGCEAWKAHLEIFAALQAKAQLLLKELRKDIQDTNWQRKSKQTATGERLRTLEAQWVALISKNYDIEQACVQLEEIGAAYAGQLRELEADRAAALAERARREEEEEEEEEEKEVEKQKRSHQQQHDDASVEMQNSQTENGDANVSDDAVDEPTVREEPAVVVGAGELTPGRAADDDIEMTAAADE